MEEAFEEGQGPHRAVEPVMMIVSYPLFVTRNYVVWCHVFDKLGCAAGEECLRNTGIAYRLWIAVFRFESQPSVY
jgi:hypothetical protein